MISMTANRDVPGGTAERDREHLQPLPFAIHMNLPR
jgi:hypothetical protein